MKKNLTRIALVLALILSFVAVDRVFKIKSGHGINQKEGIYAQPENSIDVVFMGTSHVHCGINTALLWDEFGIASYDYSGAEQPLWMTYHYLQELLKYQKPEWVVLDLYGPARFKDDYQYDWIEENIYGMKFSLNKLEMMAVSVETEKFFDYFPDFVTYHSRYDELDKDDFQYLLKDKEELAVFKGYTPYMKRVEFSKPNIVTEERDGLTAKSEKYLKKIIECAKMNNVQLALIVIPYMLTEEDKETYNEIMDIAKENEVLFIDYHDYSDDIGLDYSSDLNDESHLNYWGSSKVTRYIGDFLKENGIPDKRGQDGYESWDENVKVIEEYVEKSENDIAP